MATEEREGHRRFKTPPMSQQLTALAKSAGKVGFMFSMEQGTGKTWVAINEVAQLWGEGKLTDLIVFADNGVHTNWVELEIPAHMPDWVRYRARSWNANANKAEETEFNEIFERDAGELRIITFNWEALVAPRSLAAIKQFVKGAGRLGIVADESQGIANPQAKRVKELEKLKMESVYRRCMTGTPLLNAPFDFFAQYRFLHPSILGTTSFFAFKAEYADMMPANHPMIANIIRKMPPGARSRVPQIVETNPDGSPRYKSLDKLRRLVEPYTYRVLKSECMDLPEKVYTQTFFEMLPAQRAVYKKMDKEFRYILEGDETPVTKLVALGKLTQITSGFLMVPDPDRPKTTVVQRLARMDDNPKLRLLRERLQQSIKEFGNKVIVFAHYIEEINDLGHLLDEMELAYVTYYGATKSGERTEAIRAFQAGEVDVFIGQIQTASTGITLTAANHVIYYSNTFSYGDRSQSEDRAHRIGQTRTVLYEDLVCRGSRDLKVVQALRNKKDLAAVVNGDQRNELL